MYVEGALFSGEGADAAIATAGVEHNPEQYNGDSLQMRNPNWPTLHVLGYFSRHGAQDKQGIAEHIGNANIYFPEVPGFEAATQRLQLAANAPNTRLERFFRRKDPVEVALLGTKIAIGSMDLRASVPEEKALHQEIRHTATDSSYLDAADFSQAIDNTRERYKRFASLNNEREDGMPARFEESMNSLMERFPDLTQKSALEVVFSAGAAHSFRLTRLFRQNGIPIDRAFPAPHYILNYSNELLRNSSNGHTPTEELLKRTCTEVLISMAWEQAGARDVALPDGLPYERLAASAFSDKQMEALYSKMQATEKLDDWKDIFKYVNSVLDGNGLPPLPRTSKETQPAIAAMTAIGSLTLV